MATANFSLQEDPGADVASLGRAHDLVPFLNRLRFISQGCRSSARLDLIAACDLICHNADKSLDKYGDALVRVSSVALERPMRFLSPGAGEYSFDERWLMQILERAIARDFTSVQFMVRSRVPATKHHAFRTIVMGVAGVLRSKGGECASPVYERHDGRV